MTLESFLIDLLVVAATRDVSPATHYGSYIIIWRCRLDFIAATIGGAR